MQTEPQMAALCHVRPDQRHIVPLGASEQKLERLRAIVENLKPTSRAQLGLIDCMRNQLDALDEVHRLAARQPWLHDGAERLLWLGHHQVEQLQESFSALAMKHRAERPGVEAEETETIVVDDLDDTDTHPALRLWPASE